MALWFHFHRRRSRAGIFPRFFRASKPPSTVSPIAATVLSPSLTPTPSYRVNPYGQVETLASPDGEWQAIQDTKVGSLDLQNRTGKTCSIYPAGSGVDNAFWAKNENALFIERNHFTMSPDEGVIGTQPEQLWRLRSAWRT